MILICSLLLFFCALTNYAYYRDGLAPGVVHPVLWAALLAGASPMQQTFFELSQHTLMLVVLASMLFQAGCLIAEYFLSPPRIGPWSIDEAASRSYRNLLFVLLVLALPFYVAAAYRMGTNGPVDDFAFNLRYALSEEGESYGVLSYAVSASLFLVILESLLLSARRWWRLGTAFAIAAVFCVLQTGRTFILSLLISALFPQILTGRVKASRGLLLMLGAFLPLFYVYSVTLGKDGGGEMSSMLDVFQLYLFGGLFAFDKLTLTPMQLDHGSNLFRTFFAVLNVFMSHIPIVPIVEDYEFLPEPTNVYTVFSKAYRDFGYPGVTVYLFFLGTIHGILYNRARAGSLFYLILMVFSYSALLMQFFQDQYLSLLSIWIQVVLMSAILVAVTRMKRGCPGRDACKTPATQEGRAI